MEVVSAGSKLSFEFDILNLRVWKCCSFWSPHCTCEKQMGEKVERTCEINACKKSEAVYFRNHQFLCILYNLLFIRVERLHIFEKNITLPDFLQ